jgi:glycosyltransferase involved in cell wall biosynthesis
MKITFVLPTLDMSGGNRVVAIYARKLTDRGHEVFLVSPPGNRDRLKGDIRNFFLRMSGRPRQSRSLARPLKSHVGNLNLNYRQLEKWRPVVDKDVPDADVVVATWWETAEWVSALSATKGAKVYFVQGHEVYPWLPVQRCKATYRLPLYKIVVARWLSEVMAREYGERGVDIVHNSVDHEQFRAAPRSKQGRPTVGFLYSGAALKGVDITLRAIALLRERLPDLRVISFGMATPDVSVTAGIEFHHDPDQSSLAGLYASCDVWLTASRIEGFNLPAMEAMACRTPVISTRTGWPEEAIVDGVNGYSVPIDDAKALADAAHRLLVLPDAQWRTMSEAAFETVRNSSWDHSCSLFESALMRAVEGSASPRHRLVNRGAVRA